MMSGSNFNMPMAIRSGYSFVGREWPYLARFCVLPLGVSVITDFVAHYMRVGGVSYFEDFIWTIPAVTLLGWLVFIESRLLLLNERMPDIPADPEYLLERRRAMSASVLGWILFNMALTAICAYILWGVDKSNPLINLFWMVLAVAGVWGIRFAVAPILMAVGYPIRRYIFQVNGIAISLRLGALYILTNFPVWFINTTLLSLVMPDSFETYLAHPEKLAQLPDSTVAAIIIIQNVASVITCILGTAAFCYALKDMLSRPRQEKTV